MMLLLDETGPFADLSLKVLGPVALFTILLFFGIVAFGWRALRRPSKPGQQTLAGLAGEVRALTGQSETATTGKLSVNGEYWDFVSSRPVRIGDRVRVLAIKDVRLEVEPIVETGG